MDNKDSTQAQVVRELVDLQKRVARLEARLSTGASEDVPGGREVNYRDLVEQIPAIIYTSALDEFSTTLFVSPQVGNILGYSQEEYREDPDIWQKRLHPEDRDRVLAQVAHSIATAEPLSSEYRMIRRDGQVVWFRDEALVIQDISGKPVFMQGVMVDVTPQKLVEEELRRRDAIRRAMALAVERFLSPAPQKDDFLPMLAALGEASEVSRVYVFENHVDEAGVLLTSQRCEWHAPGISGQSDNPDVHSFPWFGGGMERWADLMGRGEVVEGLTRSFPETEQKVLAPQGILSILAVPVFVVDSWWGFIGFDDCLFERKWSAVEIDSLRIAANIFGAAIQNRQSEEALRQSESRYRAIVEAQTELVSRFLSDGTLTFVNEAYCRYFGETREELIGSRFWHHVPEEETREKLAEHIASLSLQCPVATIEHEVITSGGEVHWQQWTDLATFDAQGNIIDIQAVGRDITERKKAEQALQEAHQQLQDIIEFLPDATFVINRERRVIAWNRALEEMTGVEKEHMIGRSNHAHAVPFYGESRPTLIDLVVEDDPEFEKHYDFVERRGNTIFGEVFVPKAYEGKGAYLWGTASPLYDASGQMIGAIQSIRDITERKLAEDAILRSQKQLRFLSSRLLNAHEEERKRIARDLHDSIGQSLAAVKFYVENLLKSAGTGETTGIVASLQSLVPMIQNAMQEARRIYTGLRPSILDDLGIVATIGWFCREFQTACPRIHVEPRMEIAESDVPDPLKIVIFRVIQEALNNVAKHSGAELVDLWLLKNSTSLVLRVEDNGNGFDLESVLSNHHHERGLGLTGMKERTELSGGTFTIQAIPGEGTTITASWPRAG